MNERHASDALRPAAPVRLDFRGGGWVLALAGLMCLGVVAWRVGSFLSPGGATPALGDGRDANSYGFDLSGCTVPREMLRGAGMPRDGLTPLDDPATIGVAEMELLRLGRGPFMTSTDPVIGVEIGGEARCYPLRILIWHEVINDTLDGVPIAVTYNPLCLAAVVLDRRVGNQTLTFGVSGLVFNSNLVLYDRNADGAGVSLWSQLGARAIAGPAAARGETLTVLPGRLTSWREWISDFPMTRVLRPARAKMDLYKREAYSTYLASEELAFPAAPLPPVSASHFKTPCLGVLMKGRWHVWPIGELVEGASGGRGELAVDNQTVGYAGSAAPLAAWLTGAGPLPSASAAYFAWFSQLGDEVTWHGWLATGSP